MLISIFVVCLIVSNPCGGWSNRLFNRKTESNQARLLGGEAEEEYQRRISIVKAKTYRDSTELQKL